MNIIAIFNNNQAQTKPLLKPFAFSFNTLNTLLKHALKCTNSINMYGGESHQTRKHKTSSSFPVFRSDIGREEKKKCSEWVAN